MEGIDPLGQGDMAIRHDGADRKRKLTRAVVAVMEAIAGWRYRLPSFQKRGAFAGVLQRGHGVCKSAAVDADDAFQLAQLLKNNAGGGLVTPDRSGWSHWSWR